MRSRAVKPREATQERQRAAAPFRGVTEGGPEVPAYTPLHAAAHHIGLSRILPAPVSPQARLEISEAGDPLEEEADRVADLVMRAPDPVPAARATSAGAGDMQSMCAECQTENLDVKEEGAEEEEEEKKDAHERQSVIVLRKEAGPEKVAGASSQVTAVTRTGGQPLDAATRAFMEPRFGFDFGRVRLHNDVNATVAAASINAQAYTLGDHVVFGAGSYTPGTSDGQRLIAHELAHVVQQGTRERSDEQTVQTDKPFGAESDAGAVALDSSLLRHEVMRAPRISSRATTHTIQRKPEAVQTEALDLDSLIDEIDRVVQRLESSVMTDEAFVVNRRELVRLLAAFDSRRVQGPPSPQQLAVLERARLLVLGATMTADFAAGLTGSGEGQMLPGSLGVLDHDAMFHLAGSLPGDRPPVEGVGMFQLLPQDRMVRLLQPQSTKDLAIELYDNEAIGLQLLRTYNRTIMAKATEDGWLPAGTSLVVDPGLLSGVFAATFQAAISVREYMDRPYLTAQPEGAAVTGTVASYIAHWPEPPPPTGAMRTNTGQLLWASLRSRISTVYLSWWVEHDRAAVATGTVPLTERLAEMQVRPDQLGTEEASVQLRLHAPGTHIIRCNVSFKTHEPSDRVVLETSFGGSDVELRHAQAVATLEEVTATEWLRVEDPRQGISISPGSFAESEWLREMRPELEELAASFGSGGMSDRAEPPHRTASQPSLRGDPRALLTSLQQMRETLPEDKRDDVERQIRVLEQALQTSGPQGMRALEAIYVSAENAAQTIPLTVFVGFDPSSDSPSHLALWDFTLSGPPRVYRDGGTTDVREGLRSLVKTFAGDSPYGNGNIRFAVGPWSLPGNHRELVAETYTFETDGGMRFDDLLSALSMAALAVAVVGAAVFPPIALPALKISGMLGGAAGAMNIYDRLEHGDFEFDLQTGMDLLDIASALTLGVGTAIKISTRGVGTLTIMGRIDAIEAGIDLVQIGILAGSHVTQIGAAAIAGDKERLHEALIHALADGALFLIVHTASRHATGTADALGSEQPLGLEDADLLMHPEAEWPSYQDGTTEAGAGDGAPVHEPTPAGLTADQWRRMEESAETLGNLTIPELRLRARTDPVAAEALSLRFHRMDDRQLWKYRGDPMAQTVIASRVQFRVEVEAGGPTRFSDPQAYDSLSESLQKARQQFGTPRQARSVATPEVATTEGGTMAAAQTDVPGLEGKPYVGRSPEAGGQRNPDSLFAPPTDSQALPHTHGHAEQDLADQLHADLSQVPKSQRDGRTVHILVEAIPCSTCAQGLDQPSLSAGVLRQLSERYPEMTFEIKDLGTSKLRRIRNGLYVQQHASW